MSQPNSFVQVNNPTTLGKKLATYEFVDGADIVLSEAVTITDSAGNEVLGPKPPAESLPVVASSLPSTLQLGSETPVTGVAAIVLPGNALRVTGIVQNTGTANIRVGPAGVTATKGIRLVPNQSVIYSEPNIYLGDVWAIREGGVDSIALRQEETI